MENRLKHIFFRLPGGCTDTDEVWNAKKSTPYLRSIAVSHKAVETMVNGTLQPEMTEQSFRERICRGMQEIMKKKMSGIDGKSAFHGKC